MNQLQLLNDKREINVNVYKNIFAQSHQQYKTIIHWLQAIPDSHMMESMFLFLVENFEDECTLTCLKYLTYERGMSWRSSNWVYNFDSPYSVLSRAIILDQVQTVLWLFHVVREANMFDIRGYVLDVLYHQISFEHLQPKITLELMWDELEMTGEQELQMIDFLNQHIHLLKFFTNHSNRDLLRRVCSQHSIDKLGMIGQLIQYYNFAREMYMMKFQVTGLPDDVIEYTLLQYLL